MPRATYRTEQEEFWAGAFGNEYVDRSEGSHWVPACLHMFARILSRTSGVRSFLEFGPNVGLNLMALRQLVPDAELLAVEINARAVERLAANGFRNVREGSFLDSPPERADFVFTSGVLIHVDPDALPRAYASLYDCSNRYICVSEYYSTVPVEVDYRGNKKRLFKRDFAGEIMDRYPDVKLVDYGFVYRRDPNFAQDDTTWFLLEKRS